MRLNIVPASTGFAWFRAGLRTFWQQPLALAGLFFMYMTTASLLLLLPHVGFLLALALVPAATLGLMAATREAAQGHFPMPSILISAFRAGRERLRAMLILGAVYAVACLLLTLLSLSLAPLPTASQNLMEIIYTPEFQNHLLVRFVLYAPLSLVFWHAPALVHWHDISPAKSLFFSTVACMRNIGALSVYMMAWAGLVFGVAILLLMLVIILGSPLLLGTLIFPTGMLLAAMFFSSIWFTFRDSFVDDEPAAEPAPEPAQD